MTKSVTKPVPSTDEDVLNQLADKHPICQKIVEYRGLAKMLNTYVTGIEERLDDNAILHTKYHQPGTTTGRLSSTDPNFQNFPRSEKLIKNMFIVKKGNVLIEADEGQNEFRWWGILSGDPQLVRDLNDGVDIHRFIAALANKIPQEQVDDTQRKKAKSIVFGLMFGEGVDDLSKKHGVTVEYAQTIKDTFFSRYPTAKQWRYEIVKFARKNLFVQSRFGRRRHLLAINNPDNKIAYKDEQAACNAPIQGSASDYVSNAANRVFLRLQEEGLHGKLRNLVHDAIYVEVPKAEIRQTLQIMHEEMTRRILGIQVPLTVDAKIGVRWGRMHKIEVVNNTQKQVAN
jgi:DNA polymerase-1